MARLGTANVYSTLRFVLIDGYGRRNGIHIVGGKVRAGFGAETA